MATLNMATPARNELATAARDHRPALVTYAFRMLGRREEAEDVVQSALVRAAEAIDTGTRPDNMRAWLYRITHREVLNLVEKQQTRKRLFPRVRDREKARLSRKSGDINDILARVEELPGVYRDIVTLRFCQHLSYAETAEVLDLPVGTVKAYQARALALLQKMLGGKKA